MKSLRAGEKIIDSYAVDCKYGKASLIVTNLQMMIENPKGVLLSLEHSEVTDMRLTDPKSVRISWLEDNIGYNLTLKSDKASQIVRSYALNGKALS